MTVLELGLTLPMKLSLALIVAGLCCMTARAEDWTASGKDYHDVVVGQVEADRVHITYDGGAGTVMLSDLSPELQKKFSYDPVAAKAATEAKQKADAQAQSELDAQVRAQALQAAKAPPAPLTFQEKVEAGKAQKVKDLEGGIQGEQAFIEKQKLDAAISANDPKRVARDNQWILNAQKRIAKDRADIEKYR